jgi:hypothetical protein
MVLHSRANQEKLYQSTKTIEADETSKNGLTFPSESGKAYLVDYTKTIIKYNKSIYRESLNDCR